MQNQFNLSNDNELIYLCKEGNIKPILILIKKYQLKIKYIITRIINKFYNLPLEINDFNSFIYIWTSNAILSYNIKYKKNFDNYLFFIIKFNTLNLLTKFLTTKHQVLNNASISNLTTSSKNSIQIEIFDYNRNFLYYNLNNLKLSKLEREILNYRLKSKSNLEIQKLTSYDYKKIDNAFCRIKNKLKSLNGVD